MKPRLASFFTPLLGVLMVGDVPFQSTPPAPPATCAAPPPGWSTVKLADPPTVTALTLPTDNPLVPVVEVPVTALPKPTLKEFTLVVPLFGTMRIDRSGKVTQSRRIRDPIPSLAADTKKSLDRWVFDPAKRGGQAVDTWAAVRVDLTVAVRLHKIEKMTLTAVTPKTPIPTPFEWGADAEWYKKWNPPPVTDGAVPIEQVDTLPNPKEAPWYADSFKGPFSCKLWVKVSAAGHIENVIPIQIFDPVLIAYFRHELPTLVVRPARNKGQPTDSWNELAMSGTVGYSIELKQILSLRKTI